MDITGRKLFVKAMMEEGVDTIFGYPGGMVTDLFDELYKQDDIHLVLPKALLSNNTCCQHTIIFHVLCHNIAAWCSR